MEGMTDKYNTKLSPPEEAKFRQWVQAMSAAKGRDFAQDAFDYDIRGLYKKLGDTALAVAQQGQDVHFEDTFKKPNHPTFSTQSQYSGQNGFEGGRWTKTADGKDQYTPSESVLKMWGPQELLGYWERAEAPRGAVLVLPKGAKVEKPWAEVMYEGNLK